MAVLKGAWVGTAKLRAGKGKWGHVRGPCGATVLTLQRFGWQMVAPTKLLTDTKSEIDLQEVCPATVGKLIREAAGKRVWKMACSKTLLSLSWGCRGHG